MRPRRTCPAGSLGPLRSARSAARVALSMSRVSSRHSPCAACSAANTSAGTGDRDSRARASAASAISLARAASPTPRATARTRMHQARNDSSGGSNAACSDSVSVSSAGRLAARLRSFAARADTSIRRERSQSASSGLAPPLSLSSARLPPLSHTQISKRPRTKASAYRLTHSRVAWSADLRISSLTSSFQAAPNGSTTERAFWERASWASRRARNSVRRAASAADSPTAVRASA